MARLRCGRKKNVFKECGEGSQVRGDLTGEIMTCICLTQALPHQPPATSPTRPVTLHCFCSEFVPLDPHTSPGHRDKRNKPGDKGFLMSVFKRGIREEGGIAPWLRVLALTQAGCNARSRLDTLSGLHRHLCNGHTHTHRHTNTHISKKIN